MFSSRTRQPGAVAGYQVSAATGTRSGASTSRRASVIYVSYDGAAEPLGRSQVVSYLAGLATEFEIALISFEKGAPDPALREELSEQGILWRPLGYHKRPRLMATAWDIARGARAIGRELTRAPDAILHTRSYVATEMALRARAARSSRLLFDVRGFWVDERLESGLLREGPTHRYIRRRERRYFERADAIVTLTHASVPSIEGWTRGRDVPIEVVPTCVDVSRFAKVPPAASGPRLVWLGSMSGRYRPELAKQLSSVSGLPLTFFTRELELARATAGTGSAVLSLPASEVPAALRAGDIGLCLLRAGSSTVASTPTRFAEYLAAGMPVAITPGVGDLERIVVEECVGRVIRSEDEESLRADAAELIAVARSPETHDRCRAVAASYFNVQRGVDLYADLYRRLASLASRSAGRAG
jgi:glycosyltransferase involved in cell wall biosynthesis